MNARVSRDGEVSVRAYQEDWRSACSGLEWSVST
jgi:hypothetical protein